MSAIVFVTHNAPPAGLERAKETYGPMYAELEAGRTVSIAAASEDLNQSSTPSQLFFSSAAGVYRNRGVHKLRTVWADGRRYFWLEERAAK